MRDDAVVGEASLRRRALVGGALLVAGVVALAIGLFGGLKHPLPMVRIGAPLTFVGVAVLAPFVAGRIAEVIGSPLPVVSGVTGRLAQANATRNPRRTAATASALMVGLAVVAAIATLGASLTASFAAIIDRSVKADYVVGSRSFQGITPTVKDVLKGVPGVTAVSPYLEINWHEGAAALLSYDVVRANTVSPKDLVIFIKGPGTGAALTAALRAYPDVKLSTATGFKADRKSVSTSSW